MNCPACDSKRVHTPEDWICHPYAGHGWNGSSWTLPDLANGALNLSQGLLASIIALRDSIEAEKGILPEMAKEDDLV